MDHALGRAPMIDAPGAVVDAQRLERAARELVVQERALDRRSPQRFQPCPVSAPARLPLVVVPNLDARPSSCCVCNGAHFDRCDIATAAARK